MIKFATALRLGTAETEAILKRFTRSSLEHATYLAFAELGKAIKTIFLRRYLHSEVLRREIQEPQICLVYPLIAYGNVDERATLIQIAAKRIVC